MGFVGAMGAVEAVCGDAGDTSSRGDEEEESEVPSEEGEEEVECDRACDEADDEEDAADEPGAVAVAGAGGGGAAVVEAGIKRRGSEGGRRKWKAFPRELESGEMVMRGESGDDAEWRSILAGLICVLSPAYLRKIFSSQGKIFQH